MAQFINPFPGQTPDRPLSKRELTRAIRQGLAAEQEATHLYEAIADATDNKLVKKVMQEVADEERIHVGEFQRLLEVLISDEKKLLNEGVAEVNKNMSKASSAGLVAGFRYGRSYGANA